MQPHPHVQCVPCITNLHIFTTCPLYSCIALKQHDQYIIINHITTQTSKLEQIHNMSSFVQTTLFPPHVHSPVCHKLPHYHNMSKISYYTTCPMYHKRNNHIKTLCPICHKMSYYQTMSSLSQSHNPFQSISQSINL